MKKIDEKVMSSLESHIPELAEGAVKRAYFRTLTSGRNVVEAVDGKLIETYPDGTSSEIRTLNEPTAVTPGQKLNRRR